MLGNLVGRLARKLTLGLALGGMVLAAGCTKKIDDYMPPSLKKIEFGMSLADLEKKRPEIETANSTKAFEDNRSLDPKEFAGFFSYPHNELLPKAEYFFGDKGLEKIDIQAEGDLKRVYSPAKKGFEKRFGKPFPNDKDILFNCWSTNKLEACLRGNTNRERWAGFAVKRKLKPKSELSAHLPSGFKKLRMGMYRTDLVKTRPDIEYKANYDEGYCKEELEEGDREKVAEYFGLPNQGKIKVLYGFNKKGQLDDIDIHIEGDHLKRLTAKYKKEKGDFSRRHTRPMSGRYVWDTPDLKFVVQPGGVEGYRVITSTRVRIVGEL